MPKTNKVYIVQGIEYDGGRYESFISEVFASEQEAKDFTDSENRKPGGDVVYNYLEWEVL